MPLSCNNNRNAAQVTGIFGYGFTAQEAQQQALRAAQWQAFVDAKAWQDSVADQCPDNCRYGIPGRPIISNQKLQQPGVQRDKTIQVRLFWFWYTITIRIFEAVAQADWEASVFCTSERPTPH